MGTPQPFLIQADDWSQIDSATWLWPHFRPWEIASRRDGSLRVDAAFLDWLEDVRREFEEPMVVTSGYRPPWHQKQLTGRESGAHVDGQAVDILCHGEGAERLERIAIAHGVLGRGISQAGPVESRYLHLDMWSKRLKTGRALWSY